MSLNFKEIDYKKVEDVLVKLANGASPEQLTAGEVAILKEQFGNSWLDDLGFPQ